MLTTISIDGVRPRKEPKDDSEKEEGEFVGGQVVDVDLGKSSGDWRWVSSTGEGFGTHPLEGYVLKHLLIDLQPTEPEVEELVFADLCLTAARFHQTNPGYLFALARAESESEWNDNIIQITADDEGQVSPFKFDHATWVKLLEDYRELLTATGSGDGPQYTQFRRDHLWNPSQQLQLAALETLENTQKLAAILPDPISSLDLYLARHLSPLGAKIVKDLAGESGIDEVIKTAVKDTDIEGSKFYQSRSTLTQQNGQPVSSHVFLENCRSLLQRSLDYTAAVFGQLDNIPQTPDSTVPNTSSVVDERDRKLLDFIGKWEANGNYNAYYGNANNTAEKFTKKTIAQVLSWQDNFVARGSASSAVGKYQFIRGTLRSLVRIENIPATELFDEALQDKLALVLLNDAGRRAFRNGNITKRNYADRIAKIWAAMPVVQNPASKRGRSYYDGDGLNSAGPSTQQFLLAIR